MGGVLLILGTVGVTGYLAAAGIAGLTVLRRGEVTDGTVALRRFSATTGHVVWVAYEEAGGIVLGCARVSGQFYAAIAPRDRVRIRYLPRWWTVTQWDIPVPRRAMRPARPHGGPRRLVCEDDRRIAGYYMSLACIGVVLTLGWLFLFVGVLLWGQ